MIGSQRKGKQRRLERFLMVESNGTLKLAHSPVYSEGFSRINIQCDLYTLIVIGFNYSGRIVTK